MLTQSKAKLPLKAALLSLLLLEGLLVSVYAVRVGGEQGDAVAYSRGSDSEALDGQARGFGDAVATWCTHTVGLMKAARDFRKAGKDDVKATFDAIDTVAAHLEQLQQAQVQGVTLSNGQELPTLVKLDKAALDNIVMKFSNIGVGDYLKHIHDLRKNGYAIPKTESKFINEESKNTPGVDYFAQNMRQGIADRPWLEEVGQNLGVDLVAVMLLPLHSMATQSEKSTTARLQAALGRPDRASEKTATSEEAGMQKCGSDVDCLYAAAQSSVESNIFGPISNMISQAAGKNGVPALAGSSVLELEEVHSDEAGQELQVQGFRENMIARWARLCIQKHGILNPITIAAIGVYIVAVLIPMILQVVAVLVKVVIGAAVVLVKVLAGIVGIGLKGVGALGKMLLR